MRNLRFWQGCCWRCKSFGIRRSVVGLAVPDVLKHRNAFIFTASRSRRIAWLWRWMHYELSKRRELLAQRHITYQKTWIYTNIPTNWLTCGAERRRSVCFGIDVHPPLCRCWLSCRGSQRSALVRCMSVDNKEKCQWLFHCCDQELTFRRLMSTIVDVPHR